MSITALEGPLVVFGDANQGGNAQDVNPEKGTSLFDCGAGFMDHRLPFSYQPGQNFGANTCGWLGTSRVNTLYVVPQTKSVSILAAGGSHVTAGTAMTLATSTTTGLAVGVSITRADTGVAVTGLLCIDPLTASVTANLTSGSNVLTVTATSTGTAYHPLGLTIGSVLTDSTTAANIPANTTIIGYGGGAAAAGAGGVGSYIMSANATATATGDTVTALFVGNATGAPNAVAPGTGNAGTIHLYHPYAMCSRAVSITSTTSQVTANAFVVNGFDVYGYPMTENIVTSGTSATTTSGKKAFKYIQSITPTLTDGTGTYSAGTLDVVGFPIRSDNFQQGIAEYDVSLMMNNAAITSASGYVAAVTTVPTATTGDVRGTYLLGTSSNGTLLYAVVQSPSMPNVQTNAGLFGATQYAGF